MDNAWHAAVDETRLYLGHATGSNPFNIPPHHHDHHATWSEDIHSMPYGYQPLLPTLPTCRLTQCQPQGFLVEIPLSPHRLTRETSKSLAGRAAAVCCAERKRGMLGQEPHASSKHHLLTWSYSTTEYSQQGTSFHRLFAQERKQARASSPRLRSFLSPTSQGKMMKAEKPDLQGTPIEHRWWRQAQSRCRAGPLSNQWSLGKSRIFYT
ncbi:hypothetical protein QBC37DRAFT_113411 [Rhypophila decipiens]|uniref:Uncharacterized protein n=1 Tax=Rhypophila decipiens TaxID=261697 RepID=A0AAN7B9N4_9PEZI|nr:hypothetical protein QBC37DRAFT_113411 [Rhypophila decipiens]